MAKVFDDTFNHGSQGDDLVGTTPDTTGTDWLALFNDSTALIILDSSLDIVYSNDSADIAGGILIHANYGTVGSADVDVEIDLDIAGTLGTTQAIWAVARYADSSNYIAVRISNNATAKIKLYKVVSGSATLLGTSTNAPGAGDVVKLELRGTAWKVFIGATQEISVTESALSASGKSAIGLGDIHDDFSGDLVSDEPGATQFIVTEFDVTVTGTLVGDIGQLSGAINGTVKAFVGTLVGDIGQLSGVINGIFADDITGTIVGDIGQLTGNINGTFIPVITGTLVGDIGQLSGNINGNVSAQFTGTLVGDIGQLSGLINGTFSQDITGTLVGDIGQLVGAFSGTFLLLPQVFGGGGRNARGNIPRKTAKGIIRLRGGLATLRAPKRPRGGIF